ncbi:MAG: glycosyltransferase [Patescibacteria group bacterium]
MPVTKKKIIFVITKANWGGAQRYVYDLVTSLPARQFAPLVVLGQGEILADKLTTAGVRVVAFNQLGRDLRLLDDLRTAWALYRLFKLERPEIVHLNSSKVGGIGALAGRLARVPKIIFTVHGWAFNEARPWWQKLAIKLSSWLTIIWCHHVITVNQKELAQVKRWPGAKRRLVSIHNGLRTPDFLPQITARDELQKLLPALAEINQPGKIWVGTIAELHKNKGLDYLVTAYPSAVIIGEGEERKNLGGRAYLVGAVPNAARYLKAFDIFVLPSRKEGLPYTILEAGLAGLPVIATSVGGIPEIITSMESGILIKPQNLQELSRTLEFLIKHKDKRARFGINLRKKIRREFSLARMVKETLAVYNQP